MMQALTGRYGEMPPAGERRAPEVRVDLAETVVSAYEAWKQVAQADELELGYREALRLLGPYAWELAGATKRDFDALYSVMATPGSEQPDGVFVTAAFNLSGLAVLTDTGHEGIGYGLSQGKTLVVDNKVRLKRVGDYAAGDMALLGDAERFAEYSFGGVQISWGKTLFFGEGSQGGIKANFGWTMRIRAANCIFMNVGEAESIDLNFNRVTTINLGRIDTVWRLTLPYSSVLISNGIIGTVESPSPKGMNGYENFVNLGKVKRHWRPFTTFWDNITTFGNGMPAVEAFRDFVSKLLPKYRAVSSLLSDVQGFEAVAGMRDRPEEALAMVNAYDWKRLEVRLRATMNGDGRG
ncbi:TPA: hypothetical protein HA231_01810 [Candidatus Woesearchaeota archaeon]|nr:hypothetical protein [Candidatus Woesearchaeota archaeon]